MEKDIKNASRVFYIFEAFRLTLVKKNRQNEERRKRSGYLYFFRPRRHQTNLMLTLTHRALAICSLERLPFELHKIKFILQINGYSEHFIKSFIAKKMKQFCSLPKFGPEKRPVCLRLPWFDSVSTQFEKQVKSAVKQCFFAR